jgi:hypothetical protein
MNNALFNAQVQIDSITNSFAGFFIGASPAGVMGGANDEKFRKAIEDGIAFYKRIGIKSMNILQCESSILDDYHAIANVTWQCAFDKADRKSGEIIFHVVYIIQDLGNAPAIFAYITGDEQKALKENGLI